MGLGGTGSTLARVADTMAAMPDLEKTLAVLPPHRREMFEARVERWRPDLEAALALLFDDHVAVADRLVAQAAAAFAVRDDDLHHLDLNISRRKDCSTRERGVDDGNGHGTHVAGIIGARDNNIGVVGVAPGARIWPIKVLDAGGGGSFSDVICGIDFVTGNAHKIEVANMSLGGNGLDKPCGGTEPDALHEAICASVAAGVTYVVAAGNSAGDASQIVPASYDEVITVSALVDFDGKPGGAGGPTCRFETDDTFAEFSNYGADIDLIAPGLCILSTWRNGGYNTISGTSMASPHVAGGAALYLANHPGASPAEVKAALRAAGSSDWNNVDDPDEIKEPLLNVAGL